MITWYHCNCLVPTNTGPELENKASNYCARLSKPDETSHHTVHSFLRQNLADTPADMLGKKLRDIVSCMPLETQEVGTLDDSTDQES
jgi:hypothetical protein